MSKNPSIKSTESNLTRDSTAILANADSLSHATVSSHHTAARVSVDKQSIVDIIVPNDRPPSYISRSNTPSMEPRDSTSAESGVIVSQPGGVAWSHSNPSTLSAPGLFDMDFLLDVGQMVMHKQNLRLNQVFNPNAIQRMEIIDETRRILLHIEQDPPEDIEESFLFHLYNRHGKEVIQVLNPQSSVCLCRGATWHWFRRCRFQTVVYSPPGVVAGFVRREHTCFVQEYHILNPQEEVVLILRGGPTDLTIYSRDFENEIGRLAAQHWVGIMHEVRRSSHDIGLTFPVDLDFHYKSVLIGAVLGIDWLINCEGGKKLPAPPSTREMKPHLGLGEGDNPAINNVQDTESNIDSVQMTCSLDNESQREDARSRFSAEHRDFLTADDFTNSSLRANAGSRADIDNPSVDYTVSDSAVCVEEEDEAGSIAENVSLVSERKKD